MLWLNRPRATRGMSIEVVDDDGAMEAVVHILTEDGRVKIEVRRFGNDGPLVNFDLLDPKN
jgi:hypothetical protein